MLQTPAPYYIPYASSLNIRDFWYLFQSVWTHTDAAGLVSTQTHNAWFRTSLDVSSPALPPYRSTPQRTTGPARLAAFEDVLATSLTSRWHPLYLSGIRHPRRRQLSRLGIRLRQRRCHTPSDPSHSPIHSVRRRILQRSCLHPIHNTYDTLVSIWPNHTASRSLGFALPLRPSFHHY